MANATSTQIQELYVAYFGRAADPAGLDYWVSAGVSQAYFASVMHAQAEFQDAYGSSSTENQVNQIYKNLFNREADAAGLSYWTNQINNGVLKVAEIATHLIWAAQNNSGGAADKAALANRSAAAVAYTEEVKASTAAMTAYQPLATDPWSSGVNIQEAQDYLLTINGTTAHTAEGVTASVDKIEANGTPAAAQTFVLTTSADTFTGGNGNDQFNGVANQIDNDTFNGGRGTDTLTFTVSALDNNSSFTSTLIENIKIRATGVAVIDFGDVTGTDSLEVNRTTANLTLENINEIDPITLDRVDDNADVIFTYKSAVVEGLTDAVTITIDNSANSGIVRVDGIETVNLVSTNSPQYDRNDATENGNELVLDNAGSGSATEVVNISGAGSTTITATDALTINNSSSGEVDLTGTAATTYTHTGSGLLRITTGVADSTATASGTGALDFTDSVAGNTTVTGSSGDDTFRFAGNLDSDDTIVGGTGTDTLRILGDAAALQGTATTISVSGIETLRIDSDTAADNLDFDLLTGAAEITTVEIDGDSGDTTLDNAGNVVDDSVTLTDTQASTFIISNGTTLNAGNNSLAHDLAAVVIDLKDSSGASDAITISLDNDQTGEEFLLNAFTLTTLTANGVETINLNTTFTVTDGVDKTATGNNADEIVVTTLNSDVISTLDIGGSANLTITNALDADIDTINLSDATGTVDLVVQAGDNTITGGSGVDTIDFQTFLTTADTFNGGGGDDVIIATLSSGNFAPTLITNVEQFNINFAGGSLDASGLDDVSTYRITAATQNATWSNLGGTGTKTINQRGSSGGTNALTAGFDAGAAATVVYDMNNAGANINNSSTSFTNVETLTIDADNDIAGNASTTLGSLSGGTALKTLTLDGSSDADEGAFNTGNLTAANLETLTINADEAAVTVGTFVAAGELKTLTITNNTDEGSSGEITVGDIGTTTAADELTAFNVTTYGSSTEGDATVNLAQLDAAGSTFTFDVTLAGDYGASDIALVQATTISSMNITTGADGTSFTTTEFEVATSVGDITIDANTDFVGGAATNIWIDTATTVGNISLTSTGAMTIGADQDMLHDATTVGNLTLNADTAASSIRLGAYNSATSIGNITFTGNAGSIDWDGAPVATTIGSVSGAVAAGETVDLTDDASTLGTTGGTMGTTTVTGAGTFNMDVGEVTTLGNIDLSGMNAQGSASTIILLNDTTVGITYTGGNGTDAFTGTGGADTITAGLGADTITGNNGADNIDLTEATASADTVILNDDDATDNITGFTTGATDDVIQIDLTAINAELGGAAEVLINSAGVVGTGNNAVVQEIADEATLTAGQVSDTANIIKFTTTTLNNYAAFDYSFTTDNGQTSAGDGIITVFYDADGGFANVGYLLSDNNEVWDDDANTTFTSLATVTMTATEYGDLAAANFTFV